jgi:hypothetical protein
LSGHVPVLLNSLVKMSVAFTCAGLISPRPVSLARTRVPHTDQPKPLAMIFFPRQEE